MKSLETAMVEKICLKVSVLLVLFIGAYWIPIKAMVNIWWNNENYSHGFLIPVIAAYLLWEKRKTLKEIPVKISWKVLPALIVVILLSLYGILGSRESVSISSIPVLLILFVAFCFGIEAVKRLILPLCYLAFMAPVPAGVETSLGSYLKIISSALGGAIIGLFNIPVHVSGNVIDLGVAQLQIVDECSGLRYLFALLALGVLYAYFFEKAAWKRVVAVLSTIPIAILTNALRIGITGILTYKYGVEMAQGFYHGFSGWVIFMVAFALLFVLGRFLALFPPKGYLKKASDVTENTRLSPQANEHYSVNKAFAVSIVLLVVVGMLSLSTRFFPW